MPDKAIDVVDEAGAYRCLQAKMRVESIDVPRSKTLLQNSPNPSKTGEQLRQRTAASFGTRLTLNGVYQEPAIEALATAIKLSRAGLKLKTNRWAHSYLPANRVGNGSGQTVGQLSGVLSWCALICRSMERHTVSRLCGAPPGYGL